VRVTLALLVGAAALGLPLGASSSVGIGTNPVRVTLRVDAGGNAEVGWTTGGVRRYVLVPPRGRVFPGRRLSGRDVSRPYSGLRLPFQRVLRRTRDGRLWAVQAWRAGRPAVDVRLSRWRGKPMDVTLQVLFPGPTLGRLFGRATFQGRPVTGWSRTPAGRRFRHFAYLDCFGCPAAGAGQWTRMLGVPTREDGSFSVLLRPQWVGARYRATVTGPNRGTTLAPDGSAVAEQVPGPPPPKP
jgi:hypothetical protein